MTYGMHKALLIAAGVIGALLSVAVVVIARQPSEYRVERTAEISAPPEAVFAHVNELRKWDGWSPWAKLDPQVKNTFEGPTAGNGAIFKWSGNDKVGEGKLSILESRPHELIHMRLEFIRPFADTSETDFAFEPRGEKTTVTWSMAGKKDFMGKAVCMFMDMDKCLGGSFEEGLANLKGVVEAELKE